MQKMAKTTLQLGCGWAAAGLQPSCSWAAAAPMQG